MIELFYLIVCFVLAIFIGYEIINKVPPTLHTPLMSGTNAISGIIIIGAIALVSTANGTVANIVAASAIALATINVVGGFSVTNRMLKMFKRKQ